MDLKSKSAAVSRFVLRVIQGAIVGAGAILPGVSGGVLYAAFGYYEPMMALLARPRESIRRYYAMFIPFGIGWVVGFFALAGLIEVFFSKAEFLALMVFGGLILGTLPELFRTSHERGNSTDWTPFIITFAAVFFAFRMLEGGGSASVEANGLWYLFCGGMWGLSLVLPGFTSASILIFLGLYTPMVAGIAAFDMSVCIPFVLGIALTALPLVKLVNRLFERHYAVMSRVLLGLVLAATVVTLPRYCASFTELLIGIIGFILAYLLAVFMDKAAQRVNGDGSF